MKSLTASREVAPQTFVFSQPYSFLQQHVYMLYLLFVGTAVGDDVDATILVATQYGIGTVFVGVFNLVKFSLAHVGRVEVGACWFIAISWDERFVAVKTIPRSVMYHGETLHVGVAKVVEFGAVFVSKNLLPVDIVDDVGNLNEDAHQLFLLFSESAYVVFKWYRCILGHFIFHRYCAFCSLWYF